MFIYQFIQRIITIRHTDKPSPNNGHHSEFHPKLNFHSQNSLTFFPLQNSQPSLSALLFIKRNCSFGSMCSHHNQAKHPWNVRTNGQKIMIGRIFLMTTQRVPYFISPLVNHKTSLIVYLSWSLFFSFVRRWILIRSLGCDVDERD